MNIRSAALKTARRASWLTSITGALVIAPMTLSAATAQADSVDWDAIAQCESGGNWSTNTGNGFYGGLQFKPTTWADNGGVGHPAMASREEQIRVAENVLRTQGLRAWPKCGRNAGGPSLWSADGPQVGCQAMRSGNVLGLVDLRGLCSTFLRPFGLG
jgi:resuscitation-promoting factor RpfC